MSELIIDRAIGRMIKTKFPTCFSWKVSDKFYSGLPDRMVVMFGYFIGLEVKVPGGRLSKIQAWTLKQVEDAGGAICVVHSVAEAEAFLNQVKRRLQRDGRA